MVHELPGHHMSGDTQKTGQMELGNKYVFVCFTIPAGTLKCLFVKPLVKTTEQSSKVHFVGVAAQGKSLFLLFWPASSGTAGGGDRECDCPRWVSWRWETDAPRTPLLRDKAKNQASFAPLAVNL